MAEHRERYVHIFVHRDVLDDARDAVNRLADSDTDESILHALRDLVDPLPEVDVFGYLPNIRTSNLLVRS